MRRTAKNSNSGEGFSGRPSGVVKPMDDGIRERSVGEARPNRRRVTYALTTLITEVQALFPETPVEYSNYDGRNAALDATLDLTALSEDDRIDMVALMTVLADPAHNDDRRIKAITVDEEQGQVHIEMTPDPRIQDSRDEFGLSGAYLVLVGDDEPEDAVWEDDLDETGLLGPDWNPTPGNPLNGAPEVTAPRGGIKFGEGSL